MRAPFIVWSPEGTTEPKVTHDTHGAAHSAAHRMAKAHPGQKFYVMGVGGKPAFVPKGEVQADA